MNILQTQVIHITPQVSIGGNKRFTLIAGPCAIESEEMAYQTAYELKRICKELDIPFVFKASFDASCPHFLPELGPVADVTPLYYADTSRGFNIVPTEYVDITEEMEMKAEMLACHESQLVWLRDHDGIDIVDNQRVHAAFRGKQCGVKYAEAFCQFMGSQRVRPYRVLP